jgi:ADP-heptose:LPS heptosyltransferase
MNVRFLQRIDRYAGAPLCFCLTVVGKVFGRRPRAGPAAARRILFVKLAEQGSTVLAAPAIRRAIEMAGRENVYFVVFQENRFILDLLELIPEQNVIPICTQGFLRMGLSALKAMRRLRRLRLDAVVDMEFFSRGSAVISFLSGARARVGFHAFFGGGPYRGDLMTHRICYNPGLHTTAAFRVLVEALTQDPAKLPALDFKPPQAELELPAFVPAAGEIESVEEMLPGHTGRGRPIILLNPNAGDLLPLRQWPRERYVQLAHRLLAELPEIQIIFTGALGEAPEIEPLALQVNSTRCLSLAGKTTLRQLMVLYTLSDMLVTNDSGPAHFAALTPIRVVTLFGPETPALFAAPSPRNLPLWAGLSCSPCVNAYNNRQSTCRDNQCMKQITVNQVFNEVCRLYRQSIRDKSGGINLTGLAGSGRPDAGVNRCNASS